MNPRFCGFFVGTSHSVLSRFYIFFPGLLYHFCSMFVPQGQKAMASYQKRGDSWRALVRIKGITDTATFQRKSEAVAWASRRETEIRDGAQGKVPDKTFGDLLRKYLAEVSEKKRGHQWEQTRINKLLHGNDDEPHDPIVDVRLPVINASHIAEWRDRRLACVSPASVRREWNLLSAVCTFAMLPEVKWLLNHPMKGVTRPQDGAARDRRISEAEIEKLLFCAGYSRDVPPCTMTARVGAALIFAIETAMRAGEICALKWDEIDIENRCCRVTGVEIGGGKTASAKRSVPLSTEAIRILEQLPGARDGKAFGLSSSQSIDALFRKIKARAAIDDLHFHDTRHEAITRLSKKIEVLALARMVGHRNINELMTYYNESATDIAAKLD